MSGVEERQAWEGAAAVLPRELLRGLLALGEERLRELEELRLRRGFPMTALLPGGETETAGPPVCGEHLRQTLETASQYSVHTVLDKVQRGFVTLRGGHRVGLCGTAAVKEGRIVTLQHLSSLAIRVARPVFGQAAALLPALMEDGRPVCTLIVAPPGAGKTTLLRDLVRALSEGENGPPMRVGVADERGEIAALWQGEPQLDVGRHTDVIDGCGKSEGLSILLRGMNPEVLAVDEITEEADAEAVIRAAGCGAVLIATAHGAGREDLRRRPVYRKLLEAEVFRRLVVIRRSGGVRTAAVEKLSCCG